MIHHESSDNGSMMRRRDVALWGLGSLLTAGSLVRIAAGRETGDEDGALSLQAFDAVEPVVFPWGWIRWLMNAEIDPDAEMTLGIVEIHPNQANPVHQHPNSAEYLHVLMGHCEHRVGDRWVEIKTGDTLRIPQGVTHAARTGEEPCRVLVVYNTGRRQMVVVDDA